MCTSPPAFHSITSNTPGKNYLKNKQKDHPKDKSKHSNRPSTRIPSRKTWQTEYDYAPTDTFSPPKA